MKRLSSNPRELEEILVTLSTHPRLLVVSDFDGTISHFTGDPGKSLLDPLARVALRKLSELPNSIVAILSGRALSELTSKFEQLERVRLVGSHGHEFDLDRVCAFSVNQRVNLIEAEKYVLEAMNLCPGSRIERKPHGVAFHFREVLPTPTKIAQDLRGRLSNLGEGMVRDGDMVIEYSIVKTNKADAFARIREQTTPTISVFIGDDVTDEAAFRCLVPPDISIKVGSGESAARYALESTEDAIHFLVQLAERRTEWLQNLPGVPINHHLFLSDLRTVTLVDQNGTVDWLCAPRLDGAPLFGALVGGAGSGHFKIAASCEGRQTYLRNSLVGRTDFGELSVTDFLDCGFGRSYQRAGRSDLVRVIEGSGEVLVEFAPKFNFGRVPTRLHVTESGLRIECGQQRFVLLSPGWHWEIAREGAHDVARSKRLLNHETLALTLCIGTASSDGASRTFSSMLVETQQFWERWLATLKLPKTTPELVAQSALVLRGLSYGPSGAIAAAATTSLPETIGGVRNWDYRFCWPRDASLSATALLRVGAPGMAMKLLDWILGVVVDTEEDRFLSPLYTVTGRTVQGEAEVPEAFGYRGSRPVRIGNLASEQLQLDTLGPIAELMAELTRIGASLTSEHLQLAEKLVTLVQSRWREVDSGIWEVRGAQRHFVHSKLMCWYTVHCCEKVARYLGVEHNDWAELSQSIRSQIEREGFSERLQSYVAAYDLEEADAALLWVVLSGFHPPHHPRSIGTVRFILENLVHNGNVYRYHFNDAIHGQEGEFVICRCWLIEALAKLGDISEAKRFFTELVVMMGPLGLISEQWDHRSNCALGNFPQAYSHLGFINAACALDVVTAR